MIVDYVQNEENVEQGEWFYTSGDDGIFPKGLPAGEVTSVHPGKSLREIFVTPSGFQNGLEEVLIVIEGVHTAIPGVAPANQPVHLLAPPPPEPGAAPAVPTAQTGPLAPMRTVWSTSTGRRIGAAENHVFGGAAGTARPELQHQPGPKAAGAAETAAAQTAGAMTEFTQEFTEPRKKDRVSKFNVGAMIGIPLAAILFQVYVPQFIKYLSYLELPLLVTVYFALMKRFADRGSTVPGRGGPRAGLSVLTSSGNVRDRKDAGGLLRSLGQPALRRGKSGCEAGAGFFLFSFTKFFPYWVTGSARCWLGEALEFDPQQTLVLAVLNAAVAVPLYHILDKLKITG